MRREARYAGAKPKGKAKPKADAEVDAKAKAKGKSANDKAKVKAVSSRTILPTDGLASAAAKAKDAAKAKIKVVAWERNAPRRVLTELCELFGVTSTGSYNDVWSSIGSAVYEKCSLTLTDLLGKRPKTNFEKNPERCLKVIRTAFKGAVRDDWRFNVRVDAPCQGSPPTFGQEKVAQNDHTALAVSSGHPCELKTDKHDVIATASPRREPGTSAGLSPSPVLAPSAEPEATATSASTAPEILTAVLAASEGHTNCKTSSQKVHDLRERLSHLRGEGRGREADTSAVPAPPPVLAEVSASLVATVVPATVSAAAPPTASAHSEAASKEQEKRLLKSCKAVHEMWRLEAKRRKLEANGSTLSEDEMKTLEREADALKAFREELEALPAGSDLRPMNLDDGSEKTDKTGLHTSPRVPPGIFTMAAPPKPFFAQLEELLGDRTMTLEELASAYTIKYNKSVARELKETSLASFLCMHPHVFATVVYTGALPGGGSVRLCERRGPDAAAVPPHAPSEPSQDCLEEARRQAEAELDEAWEKVSAQP